IHEFFSTATGRARRAVSRSGGPPLLFKGGGQMIGTVGFPRGIPRPELASPGTSLSYYFDTEAFIWSRPRSKTNLKSRDASPAGNFQARAAESTRSVKYLVAGGGSRVACVTLPCASTWTRTLTRTRPVIVLSAAGGISGITRVIPSTVDAALAGRDFF